MGGRTWLGWVLVVLLALFIGFNWRPARFQFFGFERTLPLAIVLLLAALLGAATALAFLYFRGRGPPRR
jgi:uncharacterized integral membrane protein